jgi:NADPH:quinone reductase-like Zn-dependent oxidoreductase/3-oxoacyl-(acyl-carrier-protein) synthase/acyl carrier protein
MAWKPFEILRHYRLCGDAVYPAAAFLDKLSQLYEHCVITDVEFKNKLTLNGSQPNVAIEDDEEGNLIWISQDMDILKASYIDEEEEEYDDSNDSKLLHRLMAYSAKLTIDVDQFYSVLYKLGLEYGSKFRTLTSIQVSIDSRFSKGQVQTNIESTGSTIHPALLDGAFQLCVALTNKDNVMARIPRSVKSFKVFQNTKINTAYDVLIEMYDECLFNIILLNSEDDGIVAIVNGLDLTPVTFPAVPKILHQQSSSEEEMSHLNVNLSDYELVYVHGEEFISVRDKVASMDKIVFCYSDSLINSIWNGFIRCYRTEYPEKDVVSIEYDDLKELKIMFANNNQTNRDKIEHTWFDFRYSNKTLFAKTTTSNLLNDINCAMSHTEGSIESIQPVQSIIAYADNEVVVEVRAMGLNFRDVLNVLGTYPGDAGKVGTDFSGIIRHIGSTVEGFAVGDRVAGITLNGCFGSNAVTIPELIHKMKDEMTYEEGATLPSVMLTVEFGLRNLANITSASTVLIHAAAGGVGLTAIQLCKRIGCKVIGSCSESKRGILRDLGVDVIVDSRDPDKFRKEISGQQVDIVLNSLSDRFITHSLEVLREDGCFLEIGKRNIWTKEEMHRKHPNVSYYTIAIDTEMKTNIQLIKSLFSRCYTEYKPIPYKTFDMMTQSHEAFRFLLVGSGENVGKVVLARGGGGGGGEDHSILKGKHLVIGGRGGVGRLLVNYLLKKGVSTVIVASRSDPTNAGFVDCRITTVVLDVSNEDDVNAFFHQNADIDVVHHLGGSLNDSSIAEMSQSNIDATFAPKVIGTSNILKFGVNVKQFILFSSLAAHFGYSNISGQAAYASANSYLDAVALKYPDRVRSIQWGPWDIENGMANDSRLLQSLANKGIYSIDEKVGFEAFDFILRMKQPSPAVVTVCGIKKKSSTGDYSRVREEDVSIKDSILKTIEEMLYISDIDSSQPFTEMGFDSLSSVEFRNVLSTMVGSKLPTTLLYDYPTVTKLLDYLHTIHVVVDNEETTDKVDTLRFTKEEEDTKIGIVGMAIHVAGANKLDEFWDNLCKGVDSITEQHRFSTSISAGWVDQIEWFDHKFFHISYSEACRMDPQQRMVLETSYEALVDAGYCKESLEGSQTGVYVGVGSHDTALATVDNRDIYSATGNQHSIVANRMSYLFDLKGPSMAIDTACSSSLVALDFAVAHLRSGVTDMAVVAGVNYLGFEGVFTTLNNMNMLSPEGRCKTFDASADGYVRGEGCGAVVLRRLEAEDHNAYSLILGTGVNQDGRTSSLTAPNGPSQVALLKRVKQQTGVEKLDLFECHGTGTRLGDPIEVSSINQVWGRADDVDGNSSCYLGGGKQNVGHLEAGAGIVGLIKLALQLHHRTIVPNIHIKSINPEIDALNTLPNIKFPITTTTTTTTTVHGDHTLFGGVNSFGFGGTNSHAILGSLSNTRNPPKPREKHNTPLLNPQYVPLLDDVSQKEKKSGLTMRYRLTNKTRQIETTNIINSSLDYCYVQNDITDWENDRDNVIFIATENNLMVFTELLKKIVEHSHQKLYLYYCTTLVSGLRGLFFAFCQDFPDQYGAYIEYANEAMDFPKTELYNRNRDFWVHYDAKNIRSIVSITETGSKEEAPADLVHRTTTFESHTDIALVTGATGGIGSEIVKTLYQKEGVRKFIIITRSSTFSPKFIKQFLPLAEIEYKHIDLSCEEEVGNIFKEHKEENGKSNIMGIYHCAGVDTVDSYDEIGLRDYDSKVLGALYLHQYASPMVKQFWLCSSLASVVGVRSQYGYCYANAFLDTLAEKRRRSRLSVAVKNIGPVDGVGMAVKHKKAQDALGLTPIPVEEIVASFYAEDCDIISGFKKHFGSLLSTHRSLLGNMKVLKEVVVVGDDDEEKVENNIKLKTKDDIKEELKRVVQEFVNEEVDTKIPLMDAGIDSLSVVQFTNILTTSFNITLSGTLLFDFPTIELITEHIHEEIAKQECVNKELYDIVTSTTNSGDDLIVVENLVVKNKYGKIEFMGRLCFNQRDFPNCLKDIAIEKEEFVLRGNSKFSVPGAGLNQSCIVTLHEFVEKEDDKESIDIIKENIFEHFATQNCLLLEYIPATGRVKYFKSIEH